MQILTVMVRKMAAILPLAPSSNPSNSSASSGGFISSITMWGQTFANDVSAVLYSIDNAVLDIGKAVFITLIILGVFLWFSRGDRRLGKELVTGGIIIAAFIFIGVPLLLSIQFPTIPLP